MGFEKFSRSYFGSNYEKARKNFKLATKRERLEFKRKYPSADISKFVFDADLSKTGDLLTTTTKYKNANGELFDITGYLLRKITSARYIGFRGFGMSRVPYNPLSSLLTRYRTTLGISLSMRTIMLVFGVISKT